MKDKTQHKKRIRGEAHSVAVDLVESAAYGGDENRMSPKPRIHVSDQVDAKARVSNDGRDLKRA